jgi:hypothetical protein
MFQTKLAEKIKMHLLGWVTLFENRAVLWDNVEKYCSAGQATDGNIKGARALHAG